VDLFRLWFGLPVQDLLRLLFPPALLVLAVVLHAPQELRNASSGKHSLLGKLSRA
jgi:hypothetical protein